MIQYTPIDCSLDQWRKLIREQFPGVTIYVAPEEEGGTRTAYADGKFVGDWDGSESPCGRIVQR